MSCTENKKLISENKTWASDINELLKENLKIDNESLNAKLENHLTGWNIAVKSPFTGQYIPSPKMVNL